MVIWVSIGLYTFLSWFCTAFLTFFVCWPALWSYHLSIVGRPIPISGAIVLGLIGIVIWSRRKLKYLDSSVNVATARNAVRSAIAIGAIGLVTTFFVVYGTVSPFVDRIGWALITEHSIPHFFLGRIANDPGWLFYPLVLTIRSAPLTLPLALIGFAILWRQRHQSECTRTYLIYVGFSVFAILFIFCMSIGAKKFSRYVLPIFPILDILAAFGLSLLIQKITQLIDLKQRTEQVQSCSRRPNYRQKLVAYVGQQKIRRGVELTVIILTILIQGFSVLKLHPYYGTYYNFFWGLTDITKVCTIGDASGLDLAADYLNQKPNAESLLVQISPLSEEFFAHYFVGETKRNDNIRRQPDYEVVYIRESQIGYVPQNGVLDGNLEHVIRLNGIDHVWIYKLSS